MEKKYKKIKGMSLMEMIVAIGIMSIAMAGFSVLFVKSWQMNSYIFETGQDSFIASRAVRILVDDLRRARQADNGDYLISSASDMDLVIYIDIDNDNVTEKVHYYLDGSEDELNVGISNPSGSGSSITYPSGDDAVSTLAAHVVNDSEHPVFSYFGNNYFSDNTPFGTPVSSGEIVNIRIIKTSLWVDIRPYQSPDHITVESFAQLRNIGL